MVMGPGCFEKQSLVYFVFEKNKLNEIHVWYIVNMKRLKKLNFILINYYSLITTFFSYLIKYCFQIQYPLWHIILHAGTYKWHGFEKGKCVRFFLFGDVSGVATVMKKTFFIYLKGEAWLLLLLLFYFPACIWILAQCDTIDIKSIEASPFPIKNPFIYAGWITIS